jgi:type IV pilus assembly protein PilQ
VITADQVEATIEQGTEIPYQQAHLQRRDQRVQFKKATLSLKVKPQITPDDNVIMKLNVHKDSVGAADDPGPRSTRSRSRPKCWWKTAAPW